MLPFSADQTTNGWNVNGSSSAVMSSLKTSFCLYWLYVSTSIKIAKTEYKKPNKSMQPNKVKKDAHCIKPKNAKITNDTTPKNSIMGAKNSKKNQ